MILTIPDPHHPVAPIDFEPLITNGIEADIMTPTRNSDAPDWSDWHLTPAGWRRGTVQRRMNRVVVLPPSDRVLSYRLVVNEPRRTVEPTEDEKIRSGRITFRRLIIWRDEGAEARIAELLAQYGDGPGAQADRAAGV